MPWPVGLSKAVPPRGSCFAWASMRVSGVSLLAKQSLYDGRYQRMMSPSALPYSTGWKRVTGPLHAPEEEISQSPYQEVGIMGHTSQGRG